MFKLRFQAMRFILIFLFFFPMIVFGVQFQNDRLERSIKEATESSSTYQGLLGIKFVCENSSGLESLSVPFSYSNREAKGNFEYFYQKVGSIASLPTVIFLPGGPGGSSIGHPMRIPGANIIYIDPRGTGCNYGTEVDFAWQDISTDSMVDDVVSIIKKEDLKHIIIYGESYGTVAATQLAVKLQRQRNNPGLVVLDGVLGRAHGKWDNYSKSFQSIGNNFLTQFPDIRSHFRESNLPLGLSKKFWSFYLTNVGNQWTSAKNKLRTIANPDSDKYSETKQEFERMSKDFETLGKFSDFPSFFVLKSIMCSEISPDFKDLSPITKLNAVDLEDGTLKFNQFQYDQTKVGVLQGFQCRTYHFER